MCVLACVFANIFFANNYTQYTKGYMGELGVDPTDMITKARVVYDQAAKTNEAALEEADE